MKNKNLLKTVATSAFACVCTAAMVTGILAATSHTVNITTSVSFTASGVSGTFNGYTQTGETKSNYYYTDTNDNTNHVLTYNNGTTFTDWTISAIALTADDTTGAAVATNIVMEFTQSGTNPIGVGITGLGCLCGVSNLDATYTITDAASGYSVTTAQALVPQLYFEVASTGTTVLTISLSAHDTSVDISTVTVSGVSVDLATTTATNWDTATLKANDGASPATADQTIKVRKGKSIVLPSTTTFTAPANANFLGWATTGTTTVLTGSDLTISTFTTAQVFDAIWGASVSLNAGADATNGLATLIPNTTSLTITTAPTKTGMVVGGYYTAATDGTKIANANGTFLPSITNYTDANGKWIGAMNTAIYAQMLEPGLYKDGTYSTANNNFVSWATLASSNGGYWANSNNSPIVDNGNGTYSIVGYYDDYDGVDVSYFATGKLVGSLVIPSSVTSIGDDAFYGCSKLTSITIPSSVTSIGMYAFDYCTGLTNITIPSGVTSIGQCAFRGCTGLTNITIPSSVTSIGGWPFSNTAFITNLASTTATASTGVNTAFVENNVYYLTCSDDATKYICFGAIGSTKPTGDLTIKSGTVCLVVYAFNGCTSLTSITIPGSVTSIEGFAFYGCSGLTNITIPSSVTSIGSCAFNGCTGLTNITIPSSVTSIGSYAFNGCTGLTTINYTGTQAQWNAISGHGNAESASNPTRTINYNYVP